MERQPISDDLLGSNLLTQGRIAWRRLRGSSIADGRTVRASGEGTPGEREALGSTVAARLLELGAGAFLPG